jgi:hypothetical protein
MNIITNRIPRPLQCLYDLPPAAAKDFGYLGQAEACEPRLVQYKGVWYDVLDSMTCPGAVATDDTRHAFAGWDGYISDSFFSGVLFRFADESAAGDACVVVGRYTC